MTKTIILTDLRIDKIELDYIQNCAIVTYTLVTDDGHVWETGKAIFWAVLPPDPEDNWFLLPPSYIPLLVGLRNDADAALTAKYLV